MDTRDCVHVRSVEDLHVLLVVETAEWGHSTCRVAYVDTLCERVKGMLQVRRLWTSCDVSVKVVSRRIERGCVSAGMSIEADESKGKVTCPTHQSNFSHHERSLESESSASDSSIQARHLLGLECVGCSGDEKLRVQRDARGMGWKRQMLHNAIAGRSRK